MRNLLDRRVLRSRKIDSVDSINGSVLTVAPPDFSSLPEGSTVGVVVLQQSTPGGAAAPAFVGTLTVTQ